MPWLADSGNGGFSLHSRRVAIAILDAIDFSRGEPEDLFFVEHTPRVGGRLAPRHVAMHFSVESVPSTVGTPLGFHKAYEYLPRDQFIAIAQSIKYD